MVKFLLSKGAHVDGISDLGTPLVLAALKGHPSTLKILLQHGADVLFKRFVICCLFSPVLSFVGSLLRSAIVRICI